MKKNVQLLRSAKLVKFALRFVLCGLILWGFAELVSYLIVLNAANNAAYYGLRYAVTQQYEVSDCPDAASKLGFAEIDGYKGDMLDCIVSQNWVDDNPLHLAKASRERVRLNNLMMDQARLPSSKRIAEYGMNSVAPFQIVICSNEPGYYYDTAQDVCLPRDNAGIGASKILVSIHSQYWLGSTIGLHLFPIDIHAIREGPVEELR